MGYEFTITTRDFGKDGKMDDIDMVAILIRS